MIYALSALIIALAFAGVDYVISGGHINGVAVMAAFIAALLVGFQAMRK